MIPHCTSLTACLFKESTFVVEKFKCIQINRIVQWNKYKQQGPVVQPKEPHSIFCEKQQWKRIQKRIYIHVQLSHPAAQQKSMQCYKSTIFQQKKKSFKKNSIMNSYVSITQLQWSIGSLKHHFTTGSIFVSSPQNAERSRVCRPLYFIETQAWGIFIVCGASMPMLFPKIGSQTFSQTPPSSSLLINHRHTEPASWGPFSSPSPPPSAPGVPPHHPDKSKPPNQCPSAFPSGALIRFKVNPHFCPTKPLPPSGSS